MTPVIISLKENAIPIINEGLPSFRNFGNFFSRILDRSLKIPRRLSHNTTRMSTIVLPNV